MPQFANFFFFPWKILHVAIPQVLLDLHYQRMEKTTKQKLESRRTCLELWLCADMRTNSKLFRSGYRFCSINEILNNLFHKLFLTPEGEYESGVTATLKFLGRSPDDVTCRRSHMQMTGWTYGSKILPSLLREGTEN